MRLFFFNDTPTTEIYTLSLHDALPISGPVPRTSAKSTPNSFARRRAFGEISDRKSTRLNSSHVSISYAVFCLKKKNTMTADLRSQGCLPVDRVEGAGALALTFAETFLM